MGRISVHLKLYGKPYRVRNFVPESDELAFHILRVPTLMKAKFVGLEVRVS